MYQIPLSMQEQEVKDVEHNENIGNKILKRFNTIIDFKNNFIYIKPNKLFYSPMQKKNTATNRRLAQAGFRANFKVGFVLGSLVLNRQFWHIKSPPDAKRRDVNCKFCETQ